MYCCWFNNLSLQIRVSCHNTINCNRPPTEWNSKHQITKASRDHSESITYSFKCGLRRFHVYKEVWSPIVGEQLKCCYERNNCYDRHAIAATKRLRGRLADSTVGHLPREISRATRFFLLRGGVVCAKVIGKKSFDSHSSRRFRFHFHLPLYTYLLVLPEH